jgi:subtilisin-like proprotein convertase family protein
VKRIAVSICCLILACCATFAADSWLLARIGRKSADDLKILRLAGFPIVAETSPCLLFRGDPQELKALAERGYETAVLDPDAGDSRYLIVGQRPDSLKAQLDSVGTVLLREENWALVRIEASVPSEFLEDARVFVSPVPAEPVDPPRPSPSLLRPDGDASRLAGDPLVQQMVNSVSTSQIDKFWSDITANTPTGTRYSSSQGCADAGTYCYNTYVAYKIPAQYQTWSTTYKPNVIGTLAGAVHPENVYIVIGHLDDLPASGTAPGADDNASASVNVLESARVMSCYAFRNTVKFINCTGEEQGLLGSEAYAADAVSRGENILGVLNMDMIGWAGDGSPSPENLDLNYNSASQDLALRFSQAATTYGTGLSVDAFLCPSLNASDHYPFWTRGFKAVCGITDNEGYCSHSGNYPYYHTSSDTIANNGSPTFFYSTIKASVATLAELAEPFKIAFDRGAYACNGSAVTVTVGDRDLNANPAAVETATVSVSSDTETTPETVVLTETGLDSMIFTGTIATTSASPVPGDGLLSVSPGDHLSGSYTDALDCNGAANVAYGTAAVTDCTAPVITNVRSSSVTGIGATITWTTDEASNSVVHYGTAPPGTSAASSSAVVTSHSVALGGLTECTPYFYWVESADPAGNAVSDDNGGAYYTFTTGKNVNPSYAYAGAPVSIPDNSSTGASVTVSVPDASTLLDVNAKVTITHTYDGDLTLSLIGPDGTTAVLSNRRGSSGDNFTNTVFDDEATTAISSGSAPFTGSFKPDGALSAFDGKTAAGNWTLKVVDGASTDTGSIVGFELQLTYPTKVCGPSIEYAAATGTDACDGTGAGGGNGAIEPGENVALVVSAKDNGTSGVTGVRAALSTSTAGVIVTKGQATFPDIAAGQSASNASDPFGFVVAPTLPCGAAIDFSVRFTSNEGSWVSSFSLSTGTPAQTTSTYPSTDVPKSIPDTSTVTSNLPIANTGTVLDVNATVTLTHTYDGDLVLTLIGPNAARVTLASRRGSSGDNFTGTVFDDQAATEISSGSAPFTGSYRPETVLSALNGIAANGTWQLEIQDGATGDTGTLQGWSVTLKATAGATCSACVPRTAGEAADLAWPDKDTLTWSPASHAASYNLYRGAAADLPSLLTSAPDSCERASTPETTTGSSIAETPPESDFYWFLVRGVSAAGEGPAGDATAGPRTLNSAGDCP